MIYSFCVFFCKFGKINYYNECMWIWCSDVNVFYDFCLSFVVWYVCIKYVRGINKYNFFFELNDGI